MKSSICSNNLLEMLCNQNAIEIGINIHVDCPKPEKPENGYVGFNGLAPNSIAVYQCNNKGSFTRICTNGTWSGILPVCEWLSNYC